MTLRMVDKFKGLGGVLHTNTPVKEIVIKGKKAEGIRLEDGTTVKADYVISAVDTDFLYGRLIDRKYVPKDLAGAYERRKEYPITTGFQIAYAIGVSQPVSVSAFGLDARSKKIDVSDDVKSFYDLTPKGISDYLNLTKLDYSVISGGNHMIRFI